MAMGRDYDQVELQQMRGAVKNVECLDSDHADVATNRALCWRPYRSVQPNGAEDVATGMSTTIRPSKTHLQPATVASTSHKRRAEILRLRDTVRELEQKLRELQTMQGVNTMVDKSWQDMAIRQQRVREQAEREQCQLMALVETHRKAAHGLLSLL